MKREESQIVKDRLIQAAERETTGKATYVLNQEYVFSENISKWFTEDFCQRRPHLLRIRLTVVL